MCVWLPDVAFAEPSVEVLHWWTSGSEANAMETIRAGMRSLGFAWLDSPVDGGDDLKRRVISARANRNSQPDVVQLQGESLRRTANQMLPLDALAQAQHWSSTLPAIVLDSVRFDGHWVAVPIDVHRSNWIWANKKIFQDLRLQVPRTFDQLIAVADRLRKSGIAPFAFGGEAWQEAIIFDDAVLSVGGPAYYRKALLDLDPDALRSATMKQAFEQLARLRDFDDSNSPGRNWSFATEMVSHGAAAMQITGDWAKGELVRGGQVAGRDFICFAYPGTQDSFIVVNDLFAMPLHEPGRQAGQLAFASVVMDPVTQRTFNLEKGSIPARTDVPLAGYDQCSLNAASDFRRAQDSGKLVKRFAAEVPEHVRDAMAHTIAVFFAGRQTPEEAVEALATAVRLARIAPVR